MSIASFNWITIVILFNVFIRSFSFSMMNRAVSEQFQSSFRAISEQFQSIFRAIFEQFQSNFRAVSEQFSSNFWAVSEQFQSNFRAVSEQFPSSFIQQLKTKPNSSNHNNSWWRHRHSGITPASLRWWSLSRRNDSPIQQPTFKSNH